MDINNIGRVMEKIDFPKEAVRRFGGLAKTIVGNGGIFEKWNGIKAGYMAERIPVGDALEQLRELSSQLGEPNEYAAHMLFFLDCAEILEQSYRERGISGEIFWNTMGDLRCKLYECMAVKGCCGTFVASWYDGFFKVKRFALGRLQFEKREAPERLVGYSEAGITIDSGDTLINMHIPSNGPLTREKRLDSYRRAYEFFREEQRDGKMVFICSSWLLYPPYEKVFGEGANTVDFMHDFTKIFREDSDRFNDAWRVFGADADREPKDLPRNTRMRRALADWMEAGGTAGSGLGVFVYPDRWNGEI